MDDPATPTIALTRSPGPAMAALLLGVAHVRRHHVGPSGADAAMEPMVALNILRELDVLLSHAIEEAAEVAGLPRPNRRSSSRRKLRMLPTYATDIHEDAAHAAIDSIRRDLMRQRRTASSLARPGSVDIAPSDDLANSASLNAGIAFKLGRLDRSLNSVPLPRI